MIRAFCGFLFLRRIGRVNGFCEMEVYYRRRRFRLGLNFIRVDIDEDPNPISVLW